MDKCSLCGTTVHSIVQQSYLIILIKNVLLNNLLFRIDIFSKNRYKIQLSVTLWTTVHYVGQQFIVSDNCSLDSTTVLSYSFFKYSHQKGSLEQFTISD